jgi:hypothetical protein
MQPYVLLWLRYSAFILLYPLGVGSELAMVALAMPSIRQNRPLSIQASSAPGWRVHARPCSHAAAAFATMPANNQQPAVPSPCLPRALCQIMPSCLHASCPPCPPCLQLPNKFNFAFDYYWACWAVVLAYLPGAAEAAAFGVLQWGRWG